MCVTSLIDSDVVMRRIHISTYTYLYVYTYTYTHTQELDCHISTYTYLHIYTYTYTHTGFRLPQRGNAVMGPRGAAKQATRRCQHGHDPLAPSVPILALETPLERSLSPPLPLLLPPPPSLKLILSGCGGHTVGGGGGGGGVCPQRGERGETLVGGGGGWEGYVTQKVRQGTVPVATSGLQLKVARCVQSFGLGVEVEHLEVRTGYSVDLAGRF